MFVAPAEVSGVAERHEAAPFDIEDVFFSHRGDLCSFDVMLAELGLSVPALDRLAVIVRAADTARLKKTVSAGAYRSPKRSGSAFCQYAWIELT